jgi:hypothetical protein
MIVIIFESVQSMMISTYYAMDVNAIFRRSWYIAANSWKSYDFKIEVVPFIINLSTELTTSSNSRYMSKSSNYFDFLKRHVVRG